MKKEIKELNRTVKEKDKELKQYIQGEFKILCEKLFEKHPVLKNFSWSQSTPSWNDGDECNFSVNTDGVKINGLDPYDDEIPEELKKAQKDIGDILEGIPEHLMEQIFGNNKEITVTKDRLIIEDYDVGY